MFAPQLAFRCSKLRWRFKIHEDCPKSVAVLVLRSAYIRNNEVPSFPRQLYHRIRQGFAIRFLRKFPWFLPYRESISRIVYLVRDSFEIEQGYRTGMLSDGNCNLEERLPESLSGDR